MFGAVVSHLIIWQRGLRKTAVKGAIALRMLFADFSLESRSSPASKQLSILEHEVPIASIFTT